MIVGDDEACRFLIPSEEEPTRKRFSLAQICDLLKNERAPVGMSMGLYLLPVLQVPGHSFPFWKYYVENSPAMPSPIALLRARVNKISMR
jgi:hypothetical protein